MPLQLDATHPEAYTVRSREGEDLGLPKVCIYARGRMGVCAVRNQSVVPLGPAPPPSVGPGTPPGRHLKSDLENSLHVKKSVQLSVSYKYF